MTKVLKLITSRYGWIEDITDRFWGHVVVQLVETLRHKPDGRGFDSRWCHWNFSLTLSFPSCYGPGVDPASNRNKYQVYFLGVKAAGA